MVNGKIKWRPILSKTIKRSSRKGSNTEYVIALLPLGGYVKMAGMIDESMDTKIQNKNDEFQSKNLIEKIFISRFHYRLFNKHIYLVGKISLSWVVLLLMLISKVYLIN